MKLATLFEEDNILNKAIAKKIVSDCQPFIKEINHDPSNFQLYRGLTLETFARRAQLIAQDTYKADVRKDRVPLNTPKELHEVIDSWMEANLGSKFRSRSIFCAAKRTTVLSFGKPYIILPIGEFKYAWSPFIEDLYSDVEEISYASTKSENAFNEAKTQIEKVLNNADYKTGDITKMIREYPSHEIMIECDSYYAFEPNTYENYFLPLFNMV